MSQPLRRKDLRHLLSLVTNRRSFLIAAIVMLAVTGAIISKSSASFEIFNSAKEQDASSDIKSSSGASAKGVIDLLKVARGRHAATPFSLSPLAPTVTASKTDALFTDVDGDLQADPGDTLQYTVTINASGEDATSVSFTDTVDPNTAFVGGSLTATPVAVDDSYAATGNVRISVPAPGVLVNDFNGVPAGTITPGSFLSTQGGNVTLNADGSFTYNPPAGFEGVDTFSYTLTNSAGSNSGTVSINVSGMIWFIDNNASCPCDGRLTNPFNSLASFAAVNNGAGNNPAANDNIFLYESAIDYVGPVTLLNNQRFIGQDATASLATIAGITSPPFSDPLPATNSGNGTIVNITSAVNSINVASGNTLRGFTGGNSLTDIDGSAIGTLTIGDSVSPDVKLNGTGRAVNLSNGALVATLISISSIGGSQGILLSNTTGSFTVAGTGGTCTFATPTCSGGRITTTVGADNSPNGIGVSLNNVTNISLTSMRIDSHPNFAIRGRDIVGFTLQSSVVDGNNGTSATADVDLVTLNGEDSIRIVNLTGSALIDDSFIGGGYENNLRIVNNTGTLNRLTVSDTSIGDLDGAGPGRGVDNTNGEDDIFFEARAGVVMMNATVTNNILNNSRSDTVHASATSTAAMDIVFRNNTVTNNHPAILSGGGGVLLVSGGGGSSPTTTYDFSCNSFRDAKGHGLNIVKSTGSGSMSGTVFNNTIGDSGVTDSGSAEASGINIDAAGSGTHTSLIKNNNILQYNLAGITAFNNNGSSTLNLTVIGNTTTEPGAFSFAGFYAESGALAADANDFNLKLGGAGSEQNNFVDGDQFDFNDVFLFRSSSSSATFDLTQGNSTSFVPDTVVMDNNVSPITVLTDGLTVVIGVPALPAATDQTCTPPSSMMTLEGAMMRALDDDSKASNTLRTAAGESSSGQQAMKLSPGELQAMVDAAIMRWAEAGTSAEDIAKMQSLSLEIADLPEGQLATTDAMKIVIDETAAGFGWYFDPTPSDDSDFEVPVPNKEAQAREQRSAHERVDLLTVIMRQLGIFKAKGKSGLKGTERWLMENTLGTGTRRAPVLRTDAGKGRAKANTSPNASTPALAHSVDRKATKQKNNSTSSVPRRSKRTSVSHHPKLSMKNSAMPAASTSFADVNLSIGTLPAGESVVITFKVTVDNPFTGAMAQVSNQGSVSGSNFADVLTDDPDVGGTADPTVTPIDLPDVSVAVSPTSVLEDGATNLVYTFTRDGSTANALTVNFSIGGTAAFGASPNDYTQTGAASFTPPTGTVIFGVGNSTATVTVDPESDSTVELDETVILTVTSGSGYSVGAPSTATGTITNDDTDVTVAVSPGSVAEDGATNLVYTFTRNGVTTGALTVNFSIDGTASFGVSPNDYTQTGATTFTPPTGTVTFTAGNSTATVTVNPEADNTVELDETVILTVTSGAGYNVGSPSSATGTITNDDADVSLAVSPASVAEDGATNLVYTFTRTGFTGGALTVNFSVGGTATFGPSPDDYTQTGATTFTTTTGSVTFGAGNSSAAVTVNPETDATAEPDETVTLTLAAGAGYNVVSPSSATGTILNDDTVVSVAVAPTSTAEGGANLVYTFTRTGSTASALTVNFAVGGTASFPADYSQTGAATFTPPTATVTFGAGNSTATVNVTPLSDCMVEGSETVDFTVTAGTGYGVGSPSSASGTITNVPDSGAPTITLIANVNMTLWPPNHQYESIAVTDFVASASDNCDPTVDINDVYILKITSDEAENGNGDGNTLNDIVIGASCKTAQLRSERAGNGDGRVYTITFKVKDNVGNFSTATAKVTVRKSPNNPAVDSGVQYTVNSICP